MSAPGAIVDIARDPVQWPPSQPAQAWPVGSVFTSVVNTNPAALLGYGTWTAFAAGQVMIGVNALDADFTPAGKTGGDKNIPTLHHAGTAVADHAAHTHSVTSNVAVANHGDHIHTVTSNVSVASAGSMSVFGSHAAAGTDFYSPTSMGGTTLAAGANTVAQGAPTLNNNTVNTSVPGAPLTHSVTNNAVTSGNPSATLSHSVTQPSDHLAADMPILPPYVVVYFWQRTA